jgi:hypothetical protein
MRSPRRPPPNPINPRLPRRLCHAEASRVGGSDARRRVIRGDRFVGLICARFESGQHERSHPHSSPRNHGVRVLEAIFCTCTSAAEIRCASQFDHRGGAGHQWRNSRSMENQPKCAARTKFKTARLVDTGTKRSVRFKFSSAWPMDYRANLSRQRNSRHAWPVECGTECSSERNSGRAWPVEHWD